MKYQSFTKLTICIGFLLLLSHSAKSQGFPKKDINQYVWDLMLIYPTDQGWADDLKFVKSRIKTIGQLKDTMSKSPKDLVIAMNEIYDLRSKAAKMAIYGAIKSDVNIKDEEAAKMAVVGEGLEREVESSLSFLSDEITEIGKEKLTKWMGEEPALQRHKRRINRILLEAPYRSSPETQAVIESMQGWPRESSDGFFALYESDLKWPTYKNAQGKEVEIAYANYRSSRRSANAQERIDIPKALLGYVGTLQPILGYLYTKRISADLIIARHRKFDDGINAIWYLRDGIPPGTYKTMIEVGRKNKEVLNRYAAILSKVLEVDKIGYQDFYSLPKAFTKKLAIDEAWTIALNALEPLGKAYVDKARKELSKPVLHLAPSPDKRTFYSNQVPIGGMPSVSMLTFNGTYGNLRQLPGIAVSKVVYSGIPNGNWPDTRDDPPVYGNGKLYVSEILLDDYLLKHASSKEEKIFHLHNALYRLWVHAFSEIINAELDATVQNLVAENNPPNGKKISEVYMTILKSYYGEIDVSEVFANEWMVNSVIFLSYEGQFWPAAMAAACLIHQQIKSGKKEGQQYMEGLLGKGDTDLSYGLLKSVGVDLSSAKTYQAMYDRMNYLVNELQKEFR